MTHRVSRKGCKNTRFYKDIIIPKKEHNNIRKKDTILSGQRSVKHGNDKRKTKNNDWQTKQKPVDKKRRNNFKNNTGVIT